MNKKVIGFICGVAACSMLTACSGQEAAPTAASVSQSAAASESVSVSESVSSVAESVSSVAESVSSVAESASSSSGDGTDLTTEYNPEAPAKEFTAEEASIYGDIEATAQKIYDDTYNRKIAAGATPEEAAAYASALVERSTKKYEALLESNEQYIKDVQEKEAQETAEDLQEFEETYGMSFEEFNDLTDQERQDLKRELVRSGKLPKGGVG